MATSELASTRASLSPPARARAGGQTRVWGSLPLILGAALLAVIVYSAFAHGAVTRSTDTRVELVVAGLSVVAALGWLWMGALRLSAPRSSVIGVGLLTAYACWSAASVLWSVAPDSSWIEANRVITYGLVVALGIAIGASHPRGLELVSRGFVLAALAVTIYALGQKIVPGLHVAGVFDLNQTGPLPRLQEPLGYWNALAMFMVLGAPVALALTVDSGRATAARLAWACALGLIMITVPLTYSRGGLIALAVALAVAIGLGRERLRSVIWLVAIVLAALPAALVGLLLHQLGTANVPLGTREWAGAILAAVVLGGLGALVLAGRLLIAREARIHVSASRGHALRLIALTAAGALVMAGLLALAFSSRGFTGTISHLWHGFTSTHQTSNYDPQRLLSAASENRWVWWKEAAAAVSARPWQGWGAGSFPVVHLLYRHDTLPVQQPHSVPLQFLAETGVVGAILGLGAFLLLTIGATRMVRARPAGPDRMLAAALLGAALGYGIHCLFDWDWNIPALSLPAFLFLGVVAGRPVVAGLGVVARRPRVRSGYPGPRPDRLPAGVLAQRPSRRALALAGLTTCLCLFAVSVELPQLAADKARAALVAASSASPSAVRAAQVEAALASQLDPLSDSALLAEATVALHRSQPAAARVYMKQAVARDPSDPQAWQLLAQVEYGLRDPQWIVASQRAVDLDPMGHYAQTIVADQLRQAPPGSSPTRTP
jgi:O-antigen ligase/polysaccharide polymerase Wzy-like membrane protein